MQFTKNKKFFVKELSDEDQVGIVKLSQAYVDYVNSNPESLLIRFYYHFYRDSDSKVHSILLNKR
jgi:hypothetical protein